MGKQNIIILCDHNNPEYLSLKNKLKKAGHNVSRVFTDVDVIKSADFMVILGEWKNYSIKREAVDIAIEWGVKIVSANTLVNKYSTLLAWKEPDTPKGFLAPIIIGIKEKFNSLNYQLDN